MTRISRNFNEAFKWYKASAKLGNKDSRRKLSRMYFWGLGVKRNFFEAFKLLV